MNDPSIRSPAYQSLTDQQLSEIDDLCDRFDQELVDGLSPRIETFLSEAPDAAKDGLLAELLAMELEYRSAQNEKIQREEFIARFPDQKGIVANILTGAEETRFGGVDEYGSSIEAPIELENFKLIKEIGHGGMGIVWLAEQLQPVIRRVAIKLIKSDLTSDEVIARFEVEKQALAMMDHQNIAKVLDAGMTRDGRPYFVMELVEGIPITQYCDEHKLSVDERLELFVSVCKAVQHAHQKGIIHRDLKPSNVLVTKVDGEAIPKVIDFGLAKAVDHQRQLSEMTLQTEFGKVVGTVQYMSPEQAELNVAEAEDIDTRTDVYSLGVMLYEILTGSTPLDEETLGRNALLKVLEMIRDEDPPRPSNRLSSASHEQNSAVGDLRRLNPAKLRQILKGELDWVVMKALEKDRTRRYQTASDFAQDIASYLTGGAVAARPPSTWYQFQKFARRNRGLVASVAAIVLVLLAGIAGTTYGLIRANQKTKLANEKTAEAQASRKLARDSEADAKFQLANARWDASRAAEAKELLDEIPPEYRNNFEWHFCKRQFIGSDFTCYGHQGFAKGVAFSPDGTRIATTSYDSSLKIWAAESGQELKTLDGHLGQIDTTKFKSDRQETFGALPNLNVLWSKHGEGTRIISVCGNNKIKIWDVATEQTVATLAGHDSNIAGIALSPSGEQLVSVSIDATIKRWDVRSGKEILAVEHEEHVYAAAFSPDGKRLVTGGGYLGGIVLWDAISGEEITRQATPETQTMSVAFSPDGKHIAVGGNDIVTVWNTQLSQKLWSAEVESSWILSVNFSPDGTRLASTGTKDRMIRVWETVSGTELMAFAGHGNAVSEVVFSPDGARLASVSDDNTLRLWDARTGQKQISIRPHKVEINGLELSKDGSRLATTSIDGSFNLWDVETWQKIAGFDGDHLVNSNGSNCLAFSPDDAYIAISAARNVVKLLDAKTGAELKSFGVPDNNWLGAVAFTPDGKRLASTREDHTVRIWAIDSGDELANLKGHAGLVFCVAFSPDGARVVTASEDDTIKIWDAQTGQEINSLNGHTASIFNIAFSPDGNHIASSSDDSTIRIWDWRDGKEILKLAGHSNGVCATAFSPDGMRLVSTSYDYTLRLWDPIAGKELATIDRPSDRKSNLLEPGAQHFTEVIFNRDGSQIIAGTNKGTIVFFDAPRVHEVKTLKGHTDTVLRYSFSDDGSKIFSESRNETICWDLATTKPDAEAGWEIPQTPRFISPDSRWLITGDRAKLILIDLDYKNTPREKRYRRVKARFDPAWHRQRANDARSRKNSYAKEFHQALLRSNDQRSLKD